MNIATSVLHSPVQTDLGFGDLASYSIINYLTLRVSNIFCFTSGRGPSAQKLRLSPARISSILLDPSAFGAV